MDNSSYPELTVLWLVECTRKERLPHPLIDFGTLFNGIILFVVFIKQRQPTSGSLMHQSFSVLYQEQFNFNKDPSIYIKEQRLSVCVSLFLCLYPRLASKPFIRSTSDFCRIIEEHLGSDIGVLAITSLPVLWRHRPRNRVTPPPETLIFTLFPS